jgi:hypothetical protein
MRNEFRGEGGRSGRESHAVVDGYKNFGSGARGARSDP